MGLSIGQLGCSHDLIAGFPRDREETTVPYDLVSEVTHHFLHILLVRSKPISRVPLRERKQAAPPEGSIIKERGDLCHCTGVDCELLCGKSVRRMSKGSERILGTTIKKGCSSVISGSEIVPNDSCVKW